MSELDNIFDEKNVPESNWFKFDKVGDRVAGELVEVREQKSKTVGLPDQRVFVLKQADGNLINVGVSIQKDYIIGRTNNINLNDFDYKVGFEFKKEVPSSMKGYAAAKSIELYIVKTPKVAPSEV